MAQLRLSDHFCLLEISCSCCLNQRSSTLGEMSELFNALPMGEKEQYRCKRTVPKQNPKYKMDNSLLFCVLTGLN